MYVLVIELLPPLCRSKSTSDPFVSEHAIMLLKTISNASIKVYVCHDWAVTDAADSRQDKLSYRAKSKSPQPHFQSAYFFWEWSANHFKMGVGQRRDLCWIDQIRNANFSAVLYSLHLQKNTIFVFRWVKQFKYVSVLCFACTTKKDANWILL